MGGLISGFLGGASKGMAQAGQMLLASKLQKERDESLFLRDSELRKGIAAEDREYRTSEREAGQEFTAGESALDRKSREGIATTRADAKGADGSTTNMKDAASLMALGYPKDVAQAVAHGALKQIKDEDTGDMVLVNALNNTPVGRLTTIGGKKQWLPEGDQPENADVTSAHRKTAKKSASEKAGLFSTDSTDFPGTGGDRKAWAKKEAQRIANEERAGKKPGIVGSQIEAAKPDQKTSESKLIGGRQLSKEEFVKKMVAKYGEGSMDDILTTWNSIK